MNRISELKEKIIDELIRFCDIDAYMSIPKGSDVHPGCTLGTRAKKFRSCDGCGKTMFDWKGCPCKEAWYCNAICQKVHWKNGHKEVCKWRKKSEKKKSSTVNKS